MQLFRYCTCVMDVMRVNPTDQQEQAVRIHSGRLFCLTRTLSIAILPSGSRTVPVRILFVFLTRMRPLFRLLPWLSRRYRSSSFRCE